MDGQKFEMILQKPKLEDLPIIKTILEQWTYDEEVTNYLHRVENEINGIVEYNTYYWVIKYQNKTVGITGIADPLPKVKPFITGINPVEMKIMYLSNKSRGLGLGKTALAEIEVMVKALGHDEVIIRSGPMYRDTAWGFYEKMGYKNVGTVNEDMAVFRKNLK